MTLNLVLRECKPTQPTTSPPQSERYGLAVTATPAKIQCRSCEVVAKSVQQFFYKLQTVFLLEKLLSKIEVKMSPKFNHFYYSPQHADLHQFLMSIFQFFLRRQTCIQTHTRMQPKTISGAQLMNHIEIYIFHKCQQAQESKYESKLRSFQIAPESQKNATTAPSDRVHHCQRYKLSVAAAERVQNSLLLTRRADGNLLKSCILFRGLIRPKLCYWTRVDYEGHWPAVDRIRGQQDLVRVRITFVQICKSVYQPTVQKVI